MKLTAGLLTHNDERFLNRCLETLIVQEGLDPLGEAWQIVVFDNASSDQRYLKEAQERFSKVTFVLSKENSGFARGHNEIVRQYPADYHAVLNNDVLFSGTYLSRLVEALEAHTECGSATGKLLHWQVGGNPERTTIIDSTGMVVTAARLWKERGQGVSDSGQFDRSENVFGGSGAATVFRRSALEAVEDDHGCFDERLFMYKEDCDLAERLNEANLPCRYVPKAVAWHARTASSQIKRSTRSTKERAMSAANEVFIVKKHGKHWPMRTRFLAALRQKAKGIYLRVFERGVYREAHDISRLRHRPLP